MKDFDKDSLLDRYNAGKARSEEKALVESWYIRASFPAEVSDVEQILADKVKSRELLIRHMQGGRKVRLWPKIAVAAAAVAAIAICVYFFNAPRNLERGVATRDYVNDVAPGRNGATITLENGKVIQLSGAKKGVVIGDDDIVYSDSTPLSAQGESLPQGESGEVQTLIARTEKGQTYEFTLPDGTKVWLNADSKISFPSQFIGKERRILLSGEAYFAVAHNAKQPFRVESKGAGGRAQVVEDIGTEFNINAYGDEVSVKTTLVEGSARVSSFPALNNPNKGSLPAVRDDVMLTTNQQSILNGNTFQVQQADANLETAWKNGQFRFQSTDLQTIMRQISRWYNIEVSYEGNQKGRTFNGVIARNVNLSEILKIMEAGGIQFKMADAESGVAKKRIIVIQ